MTARGSAPTASASRSRRRSPSAPAITAPRAAASWRSTIWSSGGGRAACSTSAPVPACWRSPRRGRCALPSPPVDIDPLAVAAGARQCAAQPRRGLRHLPARQRTARRRSAPSRALRPDLRQYPARPAAAHGREPCGALVPRRHRRTVGAIAGPRQRGAVDLCGARLGARAAHHPRRLDNFGFATKPTVPPNGKSSRRGTRSACRRSRSIRSAYLAISRCAAVCRERCKANMKRINQCLRSRPALDAARRSSKSDGNESGACCRVHFFLFHSLPFAAPEADRRDGAQRANRQENGLFHSLFLSIG